jgi:hypothetical protein
MKKKKITKEELWCEYSGLPSTMAYSDCADYDSMGNYGRFTKEKVAKKKNLLDRLLKK